MGLVGQPRKSILSNMEIPGGEDFFPSLSELCWYIRRQASDDFFFILKMSQSMYNFMDKMNVLCQKVVGHRYW